MVKVKRSTYHTSGHRHKEEQVMHLPEEDPIVQILSSEENLEELIFGFPNRTVMYELFMDKPRSGRIIITVPDADQLTGYENAGYPNKEAVPGVTDQILVGTEWCEMGAR